MTTAHIHIIVKVEDMPDSWGKDSQPFPRLDDMIKEAVANGQWRYYGKEGGT